MLCCLNHWSCRLTFSIEQPPWKSVDIKPRSPGFEDIEFLFKKNFFFFWVWKGFENVSFTCTLKSDIVKVPDCILITSMISLLKEVYMCSEKA